MNNNKDSHSWWSGSRIIMLIFAMMLVFVWLAAPRSGPMKLSPLMRIKSTMKDISSSLKYFRTEYGRLPIQPDEMMILRTDGLLLLSLFGEPTEANPREIKFVDLPISKEGLSGITGYDEKTMSLTSSATLVDPWGERYYLLLESTGDEHIPNPERLPGAKGKATQRSPESIPASTIIFSSGPDKDPKTWDDNVCSWR